jgi:KUP system potassium uptake protein
MVTSNPPAATKRARKPIKKGGIPLSAGMVLVTLGVVYGDIGTSPMYTLKAIMSGNGGLATMSEDVVLGALSLLIWTITLITTVKYVLVAMKADNHNEGGIFALYSLVRRCGKWLIIPAMVGGAALLADGILTPAVTVTTAIEGLRTIDFFYGIIGDNQAIVVGITLVILCILFAMQKAGTSTIGKAFGPVMTVVVPLPGHHRPSQRGARPQRLPRAQPAARHHVPL